jgi:hypothetical protein
VPNDDGDASTSASRPWLNYLIVPPMAGAAGAFCSWIELNFQLGRAALVILVLYTAAVAAVTIVARDMLSARVSIVLGNVCWYFGGDFVWASAGPKHAMMYPVIIPVLAIVTLVQLAVITAVGRVAGIRERGRSHAVGLCRKCGYDLRGSSVRCPECGLPIDPGDKPSPVDAKEKSS